MPKRKAPPEPESKTKESPEHLTVTMTDDEETFLADSIEQLDLKERSSSTYDQISQMRKQIDAIHKLYTSKRAGAARTELYLSLIRFFKNKTMDQACVLFEPDWAEGKKLLEQLCQPEKGLENDKVVNKNKKIQDLTKMIMDRGATQFGFIPNICARLDLKHIVARKNFFVWKAYCLHEEEGMTNEFFQTATRREICAQALEYIEQKLKELADKLNGVKYFYVHTNEDDEFGFLCVRKQEAKSHKSCTVYFACNPGQNNIFVSVPPRTTMDQNIFNIVVESLGFSKAEDQNLKAKGLDRVYESCIRRVDVGFPTLAIANKEFDDEAKKMETETETDGNEESALLSITIKIKKGEGTIEECLAELHRNGVIKDITPYLAAVKPGQPKSVTVHFNKK